MNNLVNRNDMNIVNGYAYSDDEIIIEEYSILVPEEILDEVIEKIEFLKTMDGYELILNDDLTFKVLDKMSGIIGEYVW